jgi:hypothetical protein
MTQTTAQVNAFDGLGTLQQALKLLACIRNLAQPLTSAAGLEQALTSLVQLANLLGVSAAWTARVQSILADPAVFNLVQLMVLQLLGSGSQPATPSPSPAPAAVFNEETLNQWRPLSTEIIGLIRQIRGEQ